MSLQIKLAKYNVSILEEIKDLYIYDFGIFIEVSPDEEQKAQLEANIQMALSKGDINLEDAIDIREIRNLKLANQLLKLKRIKTQEREEKMEMQKQAMIAQQQLKSQELAGQVLLCRRLKWRLNLKCKIKQAEVAFDMQRSEQEAMLKSQLMREEFEYNMQIRGMEMNDLKSREQDERRRKSKKN